MRYKICAKCKLNLPISEFNKHAKNKDGFQYYCKSCRSRYQSDPDKKFIYNKRQREYYQKRRQLAIALFGGKCAKCPETDPLVFQFDHIVAVGGKNKRHGATLINEIISNPSKFQMLCANCHMRKTALQNEYNPVRVD